MVFTVTEGQTPAAMFGPSHYLTPRFSQLEIKLWSLEKKEMLFTPMTWELERYSIPPMHHYTHPAIGITFGTCSVVGITPITVGCRRTTLVLKTIGNFHQPPSKKGGQRIPKGSAGCGYLLNGENPRSLVAGSTTSQPCGSTSQMGPLSSSSSGNLSHQNSGMVQTLCVLTHVINFLQL